MITLPRHGTNKKGIVRKEKLESHLEAARAQVLRLKSDVESDGGERRRAREAAALRAAQDREARLEQALARLPEIEAIKKRQGKKPEEARASMTDADALVMVGVEVATTGSDQGQKVPMVEQVTARCGQALEARLGKGVALTRAD